MFHSIPSLPQSEMIPGFNISAEDLLHTAVQAVRKGQAGFLAILDRFPLPLYVTDAEGVITYHNRACIDFAGRTPVLGEDSWCVTWKLYTTAGGPLPHDQCPMAVSIRERRSIRGDQAIAECPLGTRTIFMAYPTPLLEEDGSLLGAGNILVPVTGRDRIDRT